MDTEAIKFLVEIINTGGIVGLLIVMVYMFMKGHIVPRSVYNEITQRVISEMSAQIITSIDALFKEELSKLKLEECEVEGD